MPERLIDANALKLNLPVAYGSVTDAIDNAPTVDAVRVVHGRWEIYDYDIYGFRNTGFKCSVCGRECGNLPYDRRKLAYLYCPSCGAKMDEEDEK